MRERDLQTFCLIVSSGGVFLQILLLTSALEAYIQGNFKELWAKALLSLFSLSVAALSAWISGWKTDGRTQENESKTFS